MSRAKGNEAESLACTFLFDAGFSVLERNFYSRFGEIDIIAFKEDVLHFIEVKSGEDYEHAIQNITPSKLSKIIKTAQIYMSKNSVDCDFVFDAVIVTPQKLWHVENITL
ncbi:MAG: YraN family protein [Thiovulaceae bacterium]|jgi:putative endonuclease|nr:YraN family protein [Sulfurimonadaceae bacterium]